MSWQAKCYAVALSIWAGGAVTFLWLEQMRIERPTLVTETALYLWSFLFLFPLYIQMSFMILAAESMLADAKKASLWQDKQEMD